MNHSPGSFYCFVPSHKQLWGISLSGRSVERSLSNKLIQLNSSRRLNANGTGPTEPGSAEDAEPDIHQSGVSTAFDREHNEVRTYSLRGSVLEVCPGAVELGGHLYRIQPAVRSSAEATIVFYGSIVNVAEILATQLRTLPGGGGSPHGRSPTGRSPTGGPRTASASLSSLDALMDSGADSGTQSAELVLNLYLRLGREDPLLLLNELQGQFSFVLHDSERRQVFAARDSSGRHPLYIHVDEGNGDVSLASQPITLQGGEKAEGWRAVPPGHYISGSRAQLRQFALTPLELQHRERGLAGGDEGDAFTMIGSPPKGVFSPSGRPRPPYTPVSGRPWLRDAEAIAPMTLG